MPAGDDADSSTAVKDSGASLGDLSGMTVPDLSAALVDMAQEPPDMTKPSPCAGLAYCETFESYTDATLTNGMTLGKWSVSIGGTGTVAKIDGTKAYGGVNALHVVMPAAASANVTLKSATVTAGLVAGNDVFGRAMVWYSDQNGNALPPGHSQMFNAYGDSQASGGNVSMNVASTNGKTFFNYHPATTAELSESGGSLTADAWHCLQWEYQSTNEAKLWIDSKQVLDVAPSIGWLFATPWTSFDFGLTHYQASTVGIEYWMDDFAINSAMIACPTE